MKHVKDKYNMKICLFLDNASIHKHKDVEDEAVKLDIPFIFNLPYYPELNGIEKLWGY